MGAHGHKMYDFAPHPDVLFLEFEFGGGVVWQVVSTTNLIVYYIAKGHNNTHCPNVL